MSKRILWLILAFCVLFSLAGISSASAAEEPVKIGLSLTEPDANGVVYATVKIKNIPQDTSVYGIGGGAGIALTYDSEMATVSKRTKDVVWGTFKEDIDADNGPWAGDSIWSVPAVNYPADGTIKFTAANDSGTYGLGEVDVVTFKFTLAEDFEPDNYFTVNISCENQATMIEAKVNGGELGGVPSEFEKANASVFVPDNRPENTNISIDASPVKCDGDIHNVKVMGATADDAIIITDEEGNVFNGAVYPGTHELNVKIKNPYYKTIRQKVTFVITEPDPLMVDVKLTEPTETGEIYATLSIKNILKNTSVYGIGGSGGIVINYDPAIATVSKRTSDVVWGKFKEDIDTDNGPWAGDGVWDIPAVNYPADGTIRFTAANSSGTFGLGEVDVVTFKFNLNIDAILYGNKFKLDVSSESSNTDVLLEGRVDNGEVGGVPGFKGFNDEATVDVIDLRPENTNITVSSKTVVYNGELQNIEIEGLTGADTCTIKDAQGNVFSGIADVGTYNLEVEVENRAYKTFKASATLVIEKAPLTITGIEAENREYNGAKEVAVLTENKAFNGVVAGDDVSFDVVPSEGLMEDKNVGTDKKVTVNGFTIKGADSSNYKLVNPTTTVNIFAKELTVTGVQSGVKEYDGTKEVNIITEGSEFNGLIEGDDVYFGYAPSEGLVADKNAGTNKAVVFTPFEIAGADKENYIFVQPTVTADIIKRRAYIEDIFAVDRGYNGDTLVDLVGGEVVGLVPEDDVRVIIPQQGEVDSPEPDHSKQVFVNFVVEGTEKDNYEVLQREIRVTIYEKYSKIEEGTISASVGQLRGKVFVSSANLPENAILYLALYDENDVLINTYVLDKNTALAHTLEETAICAKVFVWNNNMAPLAKNMEIIFDYPGGFYRPSGGGGGVAGGGVAGGDSSTGCPGVEIPEEINVE